MELGDIDSLQPTIGASKASIKIKVGRSVQVSGYSSVFYESCAPMLRAGLQKCTGLFTCMAVRVSLYDSSD